MPVPTPLGPGIRITPTLLLVIDATRLPEMYHRKANKSLHYTTGSFGAAESVFNMLDWRQHAHYRKLIAAPVSYFLVRSNTLWNCGGKALFLRYKRWLSFWYIAFTLGSSQVTNSTVLTNLKKMEPLVDERVHHWINILDELFVQTGEKFDFGLWAM